MAEKPKAAEVELNLLMVEDSEDDADLLVRQLERGGYHLDRARVDNAADLRSALASKPWDLIVSDYNMPGFTGVDALAIVRGTGNETPFIFVSGTMGEDTAVAALKAGAQDYLIKGKTGRLLPAIERELREARARRERSVLEAEQRAMEERYRQVLTLAADGIVVADGDLRIAIFNRGAERIFGYAASDVIGRPIDMLWPAETSDVNGRRIAELLAAPMKAGVAASEFTARRANGEAFSAEATVSRLDENGRSTVTMILRDVGERRRAEKKLRQLSRAVEQSANFVIIANAESVIEYVNPGFEEATGYVAAEVVGRRPFFWKLAPPVVDEVWAGALAGNDWHGEFDNVRKDGTLLSVSATVSPVTDEDGRISHVIAIEEDITRRREVEAQLRQAQKMEAVGNLTGGMAHDFNNLLAVVIGNLDILCGRREDDPDVQELVKEALDAAVRGADLTRRLLAFARRQPLQPQEVDLNELIGGTVKLLRRMLDADVEISLDLAPDVWSVVVDPAQLAASVTNLATNARDAMPKGGRLSISTANRVVDAEHPTVKPGKYVVITVSDSGIGIPAEVIAHIFEPFFTTKETGKGSGLGLSMVYGFMSQSCGHITVDSEPRAGTTFRLFLPRGQSTSAEKTVVSSDPEDLHGHGKTVLVVEDVALLRRVVVRQLDELGYRPVEADSVAGAVAILERQPIDILFSDVIVGSGATGFDLGRVVNSRWPTTRVLFTSGFPQARLNAGSGPPPNARILNKPYRKNDLAKALAEAQSC